MLPHDWSLVRSSLPRPIDDRWIQHLLAAETALETERELRPGLPTRLAARAFGGALDRALIHGANPASSPRLEARAALLTSQATRAELADCLDLLLARAKQPPRRRLALLRHDSILANSGLLRELASLLREPVPLYARGIAMLHRLVTDGTSPVYAGRDGTALESELRKARAALFS